MGLSLSTYHLPNKPTKCQPSNFKPVKITRLPLGVKFQENNGNIVVTFMNDGSEAQKAGIVVGDCLVRYLHESEPAGAKFHGLVHSREILENVTHLGGVGVSNPLILYFQPAVQPSKLQRASSFTSTKRYSSSSQVPLSSRKSA